MSPTSSAVQRFAPLDWILCSCLLSGLAWAEPIPSAMARNLDRLGLGAMIGAGPVYDGLHGLAPNQIVGQTWFHYRSTLVGGAGLEFSSRNPSRASAFTSSRYDLTASWIPHRTDRDAFELSLITDFTQHDGYVDTALRVPNTDDVTDIGMDVGLAARLGYGRRRSSLVAWWIAGAPGISYRFTGSNAGINYGFDGEAGLTISLQSIWYDSKTLTRAWDFFVRLPFRIETGAPDVTADGGRRASNWKLGLQVGPTALF